MKSSSLNRRYDTNDDRLRVLDKIDDLMNGKGFSHYVDKFYVQDGTESISMEIMEKLYMDCKMMPKVVELFSSYCPNLEPSIPKGDRATSEKKYELIKLALSQNNWSQLNNQIYSMMETQGDVFIYIYFDEPVSKKGKDKTESGEQYIIPKLRVLDAKNMEYILHDKANNPTAYIYRHDVCDLTLNIANGEVTEENEREEVLIFQKGSVHKISQSKTNKSDMMGLDSKGETKPIKTMISNTDELSNKISLLHIPTNKRQNEKFSVIPAEEYIDLCLQIDQINSDIRAINRNLGFPKTILLDCTFIDGDERIGGVRVAKSFNESADNGDRIKGTVVDMQIKNGLDTHFSEYEKAVNDLYDKVGITNPTLMSKVSSSDSSKMYNQVNMKMEQKISSYLDFIIEGFKPYFELLFRVNGLYTKEDDYDYSFNKPESIIKNSAYDELLNVQLKLNTQVETLYTILKSKGYTQAQIEDHFKQIEEENKKLHNKDIVDTTIKTEESK